MQAKKYKILNKDSKNQQKKLRKLDQEKKKQTLLKFLQDTKN